MFSNSSVTTRKRCRFCRPLLIACASLLIAVSAAPVRAQSDASIDTDPGDRGTGGKNTIQGSLYYPGGRRFDKRARVKLQSVQFASQYTLSDENGAFIFRRLRGGSYYITVDAGKDFEQYSQAIDIIEPGMRRRSDRDFGQTITVQINLQPRQEESVRPGTVDAKSAAIPEEAIKLYKEAVETAKAGDRKKAIEHLKKAIEIYPDFMSAHNEMGVQYLTLQQNDKAIAAFRSALKIEPEAFTPRLNYGVALLQTRDFSGAVRELGQAINRDGSSSSAHLFLGRALIYVNKYDAAEQQLQKALSLDEKQAEAHRYLGAIYIEKHENERAATELEKYLGSVPEAHDADKIREIIKQLRGQGASR